MRTCQYRAPPEGGQDTAQELALLLSANAPELNASARRAIDPVSGELVLFHRWDADAACGYESFVVQLEAFAREAGAAANELSSGSGDAPSLPRLSSLEDDAFENVWEEYLFISKFERSGEPRGERGHLLATDDGVAIFVAPEGGGHVLVSSVLAFLPLDIPDEAAVLRQLLEAHLLGEATAGACFAISGEGELIAYRRVPLDSLTATTLGSEIEQLIITAARFAQSCGLTLPMAEVT